jgi:hypothetical protein
MPHPRAPLDGGGVEAVDLQLFADLLQHAELDLGVSSVRGDDVAGQSVGGFVEALGQGLADQAEEGVEAVFLFEQVEHDAADAADAVGVVGGEGGHVVDHAGDRHKLGGAHVLVGSGGGDHDGHEGILGGHGGFGHRAAPSSGWRQIIDGGGGGQ